MATRNRKNCRFWDPAKRIRLGQAVRCPCAQTQWIIGRRFTILMAEQDEEFLLMWASLQRLFPA